MEQRVFNYTEKGTGMPMILLHGLLGEVSNWTSVESEFQHTYRVIIPVLPIYQSASGNGMEMLLEFLSDFIKHMEIEECILAGNSLGGHVAILYALQNPTKVKALILTGSSGLYENSFGGTYPKRGDRSYIKERVECTFYDPAIATEALINSVYEIIQDNKKCLSIIRWARIAQKDNVSTQLHLLTMPVLLIWGKQDQMTPPDVADTFHRLIPGAELHWIDKCGHAPMMEHPQLFNQLLKVFIDVRFKQPLHTSLSTH